MRDIRGVVRWVLPLVLLLPALVAGILLARGGPPAAPASTPERLGPPGAMLEPVRKRIPPTESPEPSEEPPTAPPARSENEGATRVQVGIYLNQIQAIDLGENAYTVDFYLWLTWTGDDIDPSASLDFVNEDAKAFPRSRPFYDEPKELADGSRYQGWHVLSTFKTTFDFTDYPRDKHVLNIDVEDNTYDASNVVYTVANSDVQYDTTARDVLGGWTMSRKPWATVHDAVYQSTFGEPTGDEKSTTYSHVTFYLELSRPASGYLAKSTIPIMIVILMTMLSFLVGDDLASRLTMCITALISAVVLHSESTRELPTVGYFVLFDWVYILAYLAIFVALVEAVFSRRLRDAGRVDWGKRLDRWVGIGVTAAYIAATAIIALA